MKAWIGAVALVGGMVSGGAAMADGNELLKQCQSNVQYIDTNGKEGSAFSAGYCMGVIAGVTSLRGLTNPALPKKLQTCLPTPLPPNIQAARIAVKYMKENPENLNMDDGIQVMLALQRAFPCE
jgi:hypothetical protein